ncbi:MAG: AI-2E family transporter [Chitinophagales bacterium]
MGGRDSLALALRNLGLVLLVTLAGVYLAKLLFPFLVGLVVAILLDPLVALLARRRLPRGLVAVFLLIGLTLAALAVVAVGLVRLSSELNRLVEEAGGAEALRRFAGSWTELGNMLRGQPAQQGLGALAKWGLVLVKGVPGAVVALVISLLSAYLLLRDWDHLLAWTLSLLPRRWRRTGEETVRRLVAGVGGIIRAQLLLALVTGTLAVIGLSFLSVGYAWLLGLAAAVLDLVPMIGPSAVFLPLALYLALTGEPGRALGVLGVAGVSAVVRQVMEPRLLAAGAGLHPLAMLLAVYAGYRLFGPFGLIVGPLAAAFFAALFQVAVQPLLDSE